MTLEARPPVGRHVPQSGGTSLSLEARPPSLEARPPSLGARPPWALGPGPPWALDGRPGFAFPTKDPQVMVVGVERHIQLLDLSSGETQDISAEVDADVTGTIIND